MITRTTLFETKVEEKEKKGEKNHCISAMIAPEKKDNGISAIHAVGASGRKIKI